VCHDSDESAADFIRGTAERELYRGNPQHGWMISTGGWQVCFIAGDRPNEFSAWPSLCPYSVLLFAGFSAKEACCHG
tara:strand:+ start:260 stop:490 length:231 start_codon:yes stop_codon:yes gene_type:complete